MGKEKKRRAKAKAAAKELKEILLNSGRLDDDQFTAIRRLVLAGADPDTRERDSMDSMSVLFRAAFQGRLEDVKFLHKRGANINLEMYGGTALFAAAGNACGAIVQ